MVPALDDKHEIKRMTFINFDTKGSIDQSHVKHRSTVGVRQFDREGLQILKPDFHIVNVLVYKSFCKYSVRFILRLKELLTL